MGQLGPGPRGPCLSADETSSWARPGMHNAAGHGCWLPFAGRCCSWTEPQCGKRLPLELCQCHMCPAGSGFVSPALAVVWTYGRGQPRLLPWARGTVHPTPAAAHAALARDRAHGCRAGHGLGGVEGHGGGVPGPRAPMNINLPLGGREEKESPAILQLLHAPIPDIKYHLPPSQFWRATFLEKGAHGKQVNMLTGGSIKIQKNN